MWWDLFRSRPALRAVAVTALVVALVADVCRVPALGMQPISSRPKLAAKSAKPRDALLQNTLAHVAVVLQPLATAVARPVQLTYAPDESGRLYIAEQAGLVLVANANGKESAQPFLDIRSLVLAVGERGVLSIAFHPHYKANGLFFITYTNLDGNTVLARYHVSKDPLRADPASAQVLLVIPQPGGEHKSGQLVFGRDGYLYMSVGDGALGAGAVYGQRKDTLLGKILRLDVDHTASGMPYAIPPDNPFVGDPKARSEIWAYGLRNPWRFSFDQATGDLYLGDVGDFSAEEIDVLRAGGHGGANFGWDVYEGNLCRRQTCSSAGLVMPIVTYAHVGGLCAVMGGFVYRGARYPALDGLYLYADFCSGRIFGLVAADATPGTPSATRLLFDLHGSISAFGQDEAGELYAMGYMPSKLYRVTAAPVS